MKKTITKDCPSCSKLIINDAGKFECNWGNAKKKKILKTPPGKSKIPLVCNLSKKEGRNIKPKYDIEELLYKKL